MLAKEEIQDGAINSIQTCQIELSKKKEMQSSKQKKKQTFFSQTRIGKPTISSFQPKLINPVKQKRSTSTLNYKKVWTPSLFMQTQELKSQQIQFQVSSTSQISGSVWNERHYKCQPSIFYFYFWKTESNIQQFQL